jgi:hypothetical protein
MVDNMATQEGYEATLKKHFKHVIQHWDSGNFKGYVASDNLAKAQAIVDQMGDLNSEFSTVKTPREVTAQAPERRGVATEQLVKRGAEIKPPGGKSLEERLGIEEGDVPAKGGFARQQLIRRAAAAKRAAAKGDVEAQPDIGATELSIGEQRRKQLLEAVAGGEAGATQKRRPVAVERRFEAQPAKKDELKLRKGGADGISKAWVKPNGQVEQLGGTWHHEWLTKNPAEAKRWGVNVADFKGTDIAGAREAALKKGFVRINYSGNRGEVTIEARERDWRRQKGPVYDFFEKNIESLDNARITLYDEGVKNVVDTEYVRLFRFPSYEEALQNIPFITGTEIRRTGRPLGQGFEAQPKERRRPLFEDSMFFPTEFDRVQRGENFGQTFTASGDVWAPKDPKVDVVTLASKNVPQADLTPQVFQEFLEPFRKLIEDGDAVAGLFNFDQNGVKMTSIDLNVPVSKKHRKNTAQFAKENDQIAIWDAEAEKVVETGGKGETVLKTPKQIEVAVKLVSKGKPADVQRIVSKNPDVAPENRPERPYNLASITKMNRKELQEHFPEAKLPRKTGELIESKITEAPLTKGLKTEEAKVAAFADKLEQEFIAGKGDPHFEAGHRWYAEWVPMLKAEFGDWAGKFAQLLAATSPRTGAEVNFRYAYEAYELWKSGKFDNIISKYNEGLEKISDNTWLPWLQKEAQAGRAVLPAKPNPATFMGEWVKAHDLKPRKADGKLFGSHGKAILKVFTDVWMSDNRGPKTLQFIKNLTGEHHGATIDVWANRTMRRLGYEGLEERWRILPGNEEGVPDADFHFSQKVFKEVADRQGTLPDAVQGAMWFSEKLRWFKNGWSPLDLGDYKRELTKIPRFKEEIQKALVEPKE